MKLSCFEVIPYTTVLTNFFYIPRIYLNTTIKASKANKTKKSKNLKTKFYPSISFPLNHRDIRTVENNLRPLITDKLYSWQKSVRTYPYFTILDGPPFVGRDPHFGHFLNKVIKDIINRYKILREFSISYIPGFDCHGIDVEINSRLSRPNSSPLSLSLSSSSSDDLEKIDIRYFSRKFAEKNIMEHCHHYRRWGILGDWQYISRTMDPQYESNQLTILNQMVKNDLIYRDYKPVYYSCIHQTSLSESELLFPNQRTESYYICFPIVSSQAPLSSWLKGFPHISLLIWTMYPWTLAANSAITFYPHHTYCIVQYKQQNKNIHLIIAQEKIDFLRNVLHQSLSIKMSFPGDLLVETICQHPWQDKASPLVPFPNSSPFKLSFSFGNYDGHNLINAHWNYGTGFIHISPLYAPLDFQIGKQYQLPQYDIINKKGIFTDTSGSQLNGLDIFTDGKERILHLLKTHQRLVKVMKCDIPLPVDKRDFQPIIYLCSNQWYLNLEKIRNIALDRLQSTRIFPSGMNKIFVTMLNERNEWCISRQRAWGLPIPAFIHKKTKEVFFNNETIEHFQTLVEKEGSDCWFTRSVSDLLPLSYKHQNDEYEKCHDIFDVWFDSGTAWYLALKDQYCEGPFDLVVEGKNQHRGWFQALLATSIASDYPSPVKTILTHGYLLDKNGQRVTTFLPVTPKPNDFLSQTIGIDTLRLCIASRDFFDDFTISNEDDLKPSDFVRYPDLDYTDQLMLHRVSYLQKDVRHYYETYNFQSVIHSVFKFLFEDCEKFYIPYCTDRVYFDIPTSSGRRGSQTVIYECLQTAIRSLCPILCFTSQEIYEHIPSPLRNYFRQNWISISSDDSIFRHGWFPSNLLWENPALNDEWQPFLSLQDTVSSLIQRSLKDKMIKSPFEAQITLSIHPESLLYYFAQKMHFNDMFGTSNTQILELDDLSSISFDAKSFQIIKKKNIYSTNLNLKDCDGRTPTTINVSLQTAKNANLLLCPRCSKYSSNDICLRCQEVLKTMESS